jgi:hypothetical protein
MCTFILLITLSILIVAVASHKQYVYNRIKFVFYLHSILLFMHLFNVILIISILYYVLILGTSAVWVAQRVPDNHISVVANQFVIRTIRKNDPNFLMSSNIYDVAKRMGWWDESNGELNFLKTYAPTRYHPNYANRRVWRVLSYANPLLNLPSVTNAYGDDYPFSVEVMPSKLLTVEDIMRLNRDHYEGTPYSTTQGKFIQEKGSIREDNYDNDYDYDFDDDNDDNDDDDDKNDVTLLFPPYLIYIVH